MTTKPKAKRFRIRRSADATPASPAKPEPQVASRVAPPRSPVSDMTAENVGRIFDNDKEDGFGDTTFPTLGTTPVGQTDNAAIDAIRREGLTGRQLRMARRVAQKQGLTPTSDYEAVKQLREQGIDPFKRSNMLDMVVNDKDKTVGDGANLPSTVVQPQVPSNDVVTEDSRAKEIIAIQRDIGKRRRKRAFLLLVRLAVFVFLPTFVAGWYYYTIATPMYGTKSEFVIQKADAPGGGLGGGLLSGTSFATSQDSITVQGYLQSRDAMLRLDKDLGFKSHFSQDFVDPLQRLETDSTNERAYKLFKKHVKIGFDPTEGVIKMEVIAADPEVSANFSKQLIVYAEEQVDQLTGRLRQDQMAGADQSRIEAEAKVQLAQNQVVDLQEKLGVLNPEVEVQAVFAQIQGLEDALLNERVSLSQFLANTRPNQARVQASQNKIAELQLLIAEKRGQLTSADDERASLARVSSELQAMQQDLLKRYEFLAQAEASFESARLEANRQTRYLSIGVSPVAPDEATYPRKFENTILAFLIFGGIYLMVSLTASILREQV